MSQIQSVGARQGVDWGGGRKDSSFTCWRMRGFSLLEMVSVVAIAGIVVVTAVPTFAAMMRSTRLTASTSQLLSTLNYARSESIKRNKRVTICTSLTLTDCARNVGWNQGWLVFEDTNSDGQRSANEDILAVVRTEFPGVTIAGNFPLRNFISYIPSGETRTLGGGLQMGVVTACADGNGRQVIVSATGRPRASSVVSC